MDIKHYFENTELTQQQIADKLGVPLVRVFTYVKNNYTPEQRRERKAKCYRNSKTGDRNPMKGKMGSTHHNFKGRVSDSKGYLLVLKPDWYTGRKGSKHVFEHSVVVCENLGITEVPIKWCVHHCDENPHNNDFSNLVLLTMSDHRRLHNSLEGATTISKESTLKWVEAHGTPLKV